MNAARLLSVFVPNARDLLDPGAPSRVTKFASILNSVWPLKKVVAPSR